MRRPWYVLLPALLCLASMEVPAAESDAAYRVLVLHSFRGSLPINNDWYTGLVRGFTSEPSLRIEIDIEAPELSRFDDAHYLDNLLGVYRRKYGETPPDLIIPTFTPALAFLVRHGEELFPGVPVVFCDAQASFVDRTPLSPAMTGVASLFDIAGTLDLALSMHPGTSDVAVVAGTGPIDTQMLEAARRELSGTDERFELTWLVGMPVDEMVTALAGMPDSTAVLFLSYLQDRDGRAEVPMDVTRRLSDAVPFPVYGLWDTLLGHGVLGGRMVTLEQDAERAAAIGLRILAGEDPSAIQVQRPARNAAIFDDRMLQRLGVDRDRLPPDRVLRFRQATAWETYRAEITLAAALILLQTGLIVSLLINRSRLRRAQTALSEQSERRRQAETQAAGLRARLARLGRQRSLGTMATSIAHEINQPLIAIQNYAQAAARRLGDTPDPDGSLSRLIGKIDQQAERAGEITRRVRAVVRAEPPRQQATAPRRLLEDAAALVGPDLDSADCALVFACPAGLPDVCSDPLQIQLVLVNLVRNAVRAVAENEGAPRVIELAAQPDGADRVRFGISDSGSGVPESRTAELFEPLASASPGGMGMGLAICREIVEAHGGRIWFEANEPSGARFLFTLRTAKP